MRRRLLLTAFLLLVLLLMLSPTLAQDNLADWTYMQYFNMDNNLESALYNDLTEMQAAGSTDQVNIVAQVDRIPGYETRFGDWTDTRRFLLQHQVSPELTPDQKILALMQLIYTQNADNPDAVRQQLAQMQTADPTQFAQLEAKIGLDPSNTALIDKIVAVNGLDWQFDTQPVQDMGELDMGDPQTLIDFVTWAMQTYPAKHYALTISTHGSGWQGNGPDETNRDTLMLPELVQALTTIKANTGVDQLDIIGFDACLMGQLEVYSALMPFTKYVLAAEELIPGNGWEYTTPFTQLNQNPTMDAVTLGTNIIDAYMKYYASSPAATKKVDLGLIDESKIPAVLDALKTFADNADQGTLDKLSELGVARINAQRFAGGTDDPIAAVSTADIVSSVDLVSFMQLLDGQPDIDPDLQAAAQAVTDAARAAVVYNGADDYLPDANGISIYFPKNSKAEALVALNDQSEPTYAAAAPAMSAWNGFLDTFHNTIDTALTPDKLKVNISQVLPNTGTTSIYDPPVMIFDTDGQGIAGLSFLAMLKQGDGSYQIVDNSPLTFSTELPSGRTINSFPSGVSQGNDFNWNVQTLEVSDGQVQVPAILSADDLGVPEGSISGTYVSQASQTPSPAYLIMSTDTSSALALYGTGDQGQIAQLRPQPGDQFIPDLYVVTADGVTTKPGDSALTFGVQPFTYQYVPAPSGDYRLAMTIQDLAGNRTLSTQDFTVDNSGLDPTWRGFKDVERGINFLYPWAWTDPTQLADDSGQIDQLVIDSADSSQHIYIAMRTDSFDQEVQNMVDLENGLTDAQVDDPVAFGSDPKTAQIITYSYTGDDGSPRVGAAVVLRVDSNDAVYTFDFDAPEAQLDTANSIFDKVVSSLTFFTPYTPPDAAATATPAS